MSTTAQQQLPRRHASVTGAITGIASQAPALAHIVGPRCTSTIVARAATPAPGLQGSGAPYQLVPAYPAYCHRLGAARVCSVSPGDSRTPAISRVETGSSKSHAAAPAVHPWQPQASTFDSRP